MDRGHDELGQNTDEKVDDGKEGTNTEPVFNEDGTTEALRINPSRNGNHQHNLDISIKIRDKKTKLKKRTKEDLRNKTLGGVSDDYTHIPCLKVTMPAGWAGAGGRAGTIRGKRCGAKDARHGRARAYLRGLPPPTAV
eukprot:1269454-Pleurochrysis_carterae.AAC.5